MRNKRNLKRRLRRLLAVILAVSFIASSISVCFSLSASEIGADSLPLSSDSILRDYADGAEIDSAGYTARLTELEDDNTYVFDNGDGTHTVYMMYEDLKYTDSSGKVREKDLSLVRKDGGYTIASSDIGIYMPDSPEKGIDISYAGCSLTITPYGTADCVALTDKGAVVYPGVFGENTFLRYTPLLSGIKEDIILSEYTEKASFTFLLESENLELFGNEDDGYCFAETEENSLVFRLRDVVVYDAVGKPAGGSMEVTNLSKGRYEITISANDEFLSDPDTVYPVTVDPTVTVSDKVQGSSSIEDAPIFELQPNRNCGTYLYNSIGTTSSSYGVGRTAVRLGGLLNLDVYPSLTAAQIMSVNFYAKDASGSGSQFINLYPLTGNTTWTESNVTWNNVGSHSIGKNCGASMRTGQWTSFDITGLVKAWKNGTYPAQAGFILINENEANNKCFYSSESASDDNKPYVKFTYEAGLSLSQGSFYVNEDSTQMVYATTHPSGLGVTWTSADSGVATVDSTGKVTGVRAGTTIITATATNSAGAVYTASCTVTVLVHNGAYFLKNKNLGPYADIENGTMSNGTAIRQWTLTGEMTQRWIATNIGGSWFTLKSANSSTPHYLGVKNDSTSSGADIVLRTGSITDGMKWKIEYTCDGAYKLTTKTGFVLASFNQTGLDGVKLIQTQYVNDNIYTDEWELERMLPTNGYELSYTPSVWNGQFTIYGNCYAYAINNQLVPSTNILWFMQQSGEYAGAAITLPLTESKIFAAVSNDFSEYNTDFNTSLTFRRIGRYDVCPAGTYKVALVVGVYPNGAPDYHWYRQDADGLWSHKPGITEVSRTDKSGKFIIDPMTADRGYYTQFLGYYAVSPWGNMFTEPASGQVRYKYDGDIITYDKLLEELHKRGYSYYDARGEKCLPSGRIDWGETE
jgi:hypothetical protein